MRNQNQLAAQTRLEDFMHWIPDDRLSVSRFIQHGASMIGEEDFATLDAILPDLLERAAILASRSSREAFDLECLIRAYEAAAQSGRPLPSQVLREVAFALLYHEKSECVQPEYSGMVGLLEGRTVMEIVVLRNRRELGAVADRGEWEDAPPRFRMRRNLRTRLELSGR